MCHGHKFSINPRSHRIEACLTCDGTGSVNTEYRCRCGRPAVRPVADTVVCTRQECTNRALGLVNNVSVNVNCLC